MEEKELLTHMAQGLYQVAIENKVQGMYRENLKFLDWILTVEPDLKKFLNSPFIPLATKVKSLDELLGELLVPEVLSFVRILIRDKVIGSFHDIRKEYDRLSDEQANIISGVVYTPFKLTNSDKERLAKVFSRQLGKDVVLTVVEDKNLLSGIKVLLDGFVYEYSANQRLEKLKETLAYSKV